MNQSLLEKWNRLTELERIVDQNIEEIKKLNSKLDSVCNQTKIAKQNKKM